MAQAYYSPDVVQTGQVPSTQTNFPRLFLPTDNRFRTIANGGHVANANGYDIRPYSDAALTTALTFELVPGTYNASTGTFEMWVLVPSLADGYVVHLCYGDASLTTDGSSTSTWPSQYKGVYHFGSSASLSLSDSTSNANTLTNSGAVAAAGKIGGGASVNGTSDYLVTGSNIGISGAGTRTLKLWVNPNAVTTPSKYLLAMGVDDGTFHPFDLAVGVGGTGVIYDYNSATDWQSAGSAISPSVMSRLVITYNGGAIQTAGSVKIYKDGSLVTISATGGGTGVLNTSAAPLNIGRYQGNSNFIGGILDEVQASNTEDSANWITTEYNNQSAPGTFSVLGTEVAVGGASPTYPQIERGIRGLTRGLAQAA